MCGGAAALVEALDESGVELSGDELRVSHNFAEEGERGLDSADGVLGERAAHALDGLGARAPPRCELRDKGVVVDRNFRALVDAAVVAHAGARGHAKACDSTGRRHEVLLRVFGVDAALDGVARPAYFVLRERERQARRDSNLLPAQVKTLDEFRDPM